MDYKTKEYHRRKAKEHYWKNKAAYNKRNQEQRARTRAIITEAKSVGCKVCPEKAIPALDFHHLRGKDKIISSMLGMNDERVRKEISKCVVVCRNCHAKIHAGLITLRN